MEPGLGRPDRNAESSGHFDGREADVVAQDQHGSLRVGQASQAAFDLIPVGEISRPVALTRLGGDQDDLGTPPALVPADVGTAADKQPVEPRVEPFHVAQRRQVAPGSHEGVLGRILGELGVAQDVASDGVQSIDGTAGEHGEGLPVPASRLLDEDRLHARSFQGATDLIAYTLRR